MANFSWLQHDDDDDDGGDFDSALRTGHRVDQIKGR